jgi:hypothetical protein
MSGKTKEKTTKIVKINYLFILILYIKNLNNFEKVLIFRKKKKILNLLKKK